jgi:ParB family chromosome partitioning protein
MSEALSAQKKVAGVLMEIPLGEIRPFKNQPRKHFNQDALNDLARSIAAEGQNIRGAVMRISDPVHGYELIYGERRWQACAIAKVPFYRAEVFDTMSPKDQYAMSVLENFARQDCTLIESANAVENMGREFFGESPEWGDRVAATLAEKFGRSSTWIYQTRSLLKLHPDIQARMDPGTPKKDRVTFQLGVSLAKYPHARQLKFLRDIAKKGYSQKRALAHVRLDTSATATGKGRNRPYENYGVIQRFLARIGESAEIIMDMNVRQFEAMFLSRPASDLRNLIKMVGDREQQLSTIRQTLERIQKQKGTRTRF